MMNVIIPYLVRVHHMSHKLPIIKELSRQIETYLHQRYMAPLSYRDIYRTQREFKMIQSIQSRLKKGKYILRVTDKSGIFHIDHATDYEQKAEAYRQKTGAYTELENDPLWTIFDKVIHLLNNLRSKDHIRVWQLNKMMPKQDQVELAYLYFIPKPHKVICESDLLKPKCLSDLFLLGRNTIKTYCLIYEHTNYCYFKILRSITSTII